MIKWTIPQIVWLSPSTLTKIRDQPSKKIELEFFRLPLPKFQTHQDAMASKVKGRAMIDLNLAMNPNIIGIKGKFALEAHEPLPSDSTVDHKNKKSRELELMKDLDIYKSIGTTISLRIMFSASLVSKKKLKNVFIL
jgi:hypothetical protein